jgi:glucose-1-phosphate adenylyltransferase
VQIWAAEQTMQGTEWYQGTADAVRKQIHEIRSAHAPYTLILSGDHLYRMDYAKMAEFHWARNADITVAVQPTTWADVSRFGILKRDDDFRIVDFAEKPKERAKQESMISRADADRPFLASMGIYLFSTELLIELLSSSTAEDFGNHIIPAAIHTQSVYGFDFEGYWEDIGTIRSFYETNLALTTQEAPFDLYDPVRPLYTHARILPASRVENSRLRDVLLAEGCCVEQADIDHSIIGVRAQIGAGCQIRDSIIMGADYYDFDEPLQRTGVPMGIGAGCVIEGAIVDKNARVGAGTTIRYFPPGTDIDHALYVVRDGIPVMLEEEARKLASDDPLLAE